MLLKHLWPAYLEKRVSALCSRRIVIVLQRLLQNQGGKVPFKFISGIDLQVKTSGPSAPSPPSVSRESALLMMRPLHPKASDSHHCAAGDGDGNDDDDDDDDGDDDNDDDDDEEEEEDDEMMMMRRRRRRRGRMMMMIGLKTTTIYMMMMMMMMTISSPFFRHCRSLASDPLRQRCPPARPDTLPRGTTSSLSSASTSPLAAGCREWCVGRSSRLCSRSSPATAAPHPDPLQLPPSPPMCLCCCRSPPR